MAQTYKKALLTAWPSVKSDQGLYGEKCILGGSPVELRMVIYTEELSWNRLGLGIQHREVRLSEVVSVWSENRLWAIGPSLSGSC